MVPDSLKAELEQDPQAWVDTCWLLVHMRSPSPSIFRSTVVILHVQDGRALVSELWAPAYARFWIPLEAFQVEYSTLTYLAKAPELDWIHPGSWVCSTHEERTLKRHPELGELGYSPFWNVRDIVGLHVELHDRLGPEQDDPVIRVREGSRWFLPTFLRQFRPASHEEWSAARALYGSVRRPPFGTGMPSFEGRVVNRTQLEDTLQRHEMADQLYAARKALANQPKQEEAVSEEGPVQDRWAMLQGGEE